MSGATTRARLNALQIWNMCFGFFGIQMGFGLQNAETSRIFQTLGAKIDDLAVLWIAAPLTGLLVQPIVGYWSDRTWCRLGRRRPYFFWGALLSSAALIILPNAASLWVAAGALWLLDASINVTMEPFRAFVADQMPDEQRTSGYAMQSFFIGAGAVLASCLPWLLTHWLHVGEHPWRGEVPATVHLAFYIGAAGLLATVLWTVFTTREHSPEQLAAFEPPVARAAPAEAAAPPARTYLGVGGGFLVAGLAVIAAVAGLRLEKELYLLGVFAVGFGGMQLTAGWLRRRGVRPNGFSEVMEDLLRMPRPMRQLAVVQFFSWFGLFAMWIYTTPAVTAFHFRAVDTASAAYNAGADWVGVLFAVYNGVAALAAFIIPLLARLTSRRVAHMINLCLGGLGLLSFMLIRRPELLWVGMVGVGFAWASILSVPYSILAGALPAQKVGIYMGIFNFFIVLPQLLAATVLGLLLKTFFDGQAIWALVLGAVSMFIAALSVLGVTDQAEPIRVQAPVLPPRPDEALPFAASISSRR